RSGKVRFTNRQKDALRVSIHEARIVVTDDQGRVVWEDPDEVRLIQRLFEFAVARDAINALGELADVLERHEGGQPHYASVEAKAIARARLIIADSLPSPRDEATLLSRSTQLDLWRRAA